MLLEDRNAPPEEKKRSLLHLAVTILLVLAGLFWISLFTLSGIGGKSDALEAGAEDYLRRATGMEASVGDFGYIHFYPDIKVDMGDIKLSEKKGVDPSITAGSFRYEMSFWDLFFFRYRIAALEITDMRVKQGLATRHDVRFERIALEGSALTVTGAYGEDSFRATLAMEEKAAAGGRKFFKRPEKSALKLESPFLNLEGHMSAAEGGGMQMDLTSIGMPEKMLEGRLVVVKPGKKGTPEVSGSLKSVGDPEKAAAAVAGLYCLLAANPDMKMFRERSQKVTVDGRKLGEMAEDVSCP